MLSPFELIVQSFQDYKKEAPILIGYSAWLLLPFAAFVLLSTLPTSPVIQVMAFFLMIAELFLLVWIMIILSLYAFAHIHGHEKNIGVFSKKGRALIAPLLTVILLQILVLAGGFLLFVIPMFIFAVWFGLSQLTVIFENRRGINALFASRALIQGRFWQAAGLLIGGTFIILFVYSFILSLIISAYAALQNLDPVDLLVGELPLWINILEAVGEILLLPLLAIYLTRVYVALKEVAGI